MRCGGSAPLATSKRTMAFVLRGRLGNHGERGHLTYSTRWHCRISLRARRARWTARPPLGGTPRAHELSAGDCHIDSPQPSPMDATRAAASGTDRLRSRPRHVNPASPLLPIPH